MRTRTFLSVLFFLCGISCFYDAAWASLVVPFYGEFDPSAGQVKLHLGGAESPSIDVKIGRLLAGQYHLNMDVNHVPVPLTDLATVIYGDLKISGADRGHRELTWKMRSRYTLLDHKPAYDLQMGFSFRNRKMYVDLFKIGSLSAKGEVGLTKDHPVSLWVDLLPVNMEEALALIGYDEQALEMTGTVSATLNITGSLRRPDIKGKLSFYNGELRAYPYDSILLQFDGVYPVITLKDSTVTQMGGFSFKLAGSVDLQKLNRLPVQLKELKRTPIVSTTDVNKREWVLKREAEGSAVTEMKYLFLKDDRGDAEGIIGIERKIGF